MLDKSGCRKLQLVEPSADAGFSFSYGLQAWSLSLAVAFRQGRYRSAPLAPLPGPSPDAGNAPWMQPKLMTTQ